MTAELAKVIYSCRCRSVWILDIDDVGRPFIDILEASYERICEGSKRSFNSVTPDSLSGA